MLAKSQIQKKALSSRRAAAQRNNRQTAVDVILSAAKDLIHKTAGEIITTSPAANSRINQGTSAPGTLGAQRLIGLRNEVRRRFASPQKIPQSARTNAKKYLRL